MLRILVMTAALSAVPVAAVLAQKSSVAAGPTVRLMTLDPGHFHASLVQKEMYPGVSSKVDVYAPLGPDLIEHLNRVIRFNSRPDNPTSWQLEVHTGPDFFERMLRERPGNVAVLSGRNRGKIDRIKASVEAGLNVLSDKPWVVRAEDLPKLESSLATAAKKGLVAYDIMTERYEITTMLQKELVNEPSVYGAQLPGTEKEPGVYMESVHHIMKMVAGAPNLRPAWFFDVLQQGEGLTDVGTHLVDLAAWTLYPQTLLDYRKDVHVLAARRWPTVISKAEFQKVTGEKDFPDYLASNVKADKLDYFCNTQVSYALRGTHVKLDVLWNYEAPVGGGDTHYAVYRGSKARVELRQKGEKTNLPELYVVPNSAAGKAELLAALQKKVQVWQRDYAGVALQDAGDAIWVTVPDRYRVGHEAHFAQVTTRFLQYLKNPKALPAWENANMLAKYYVTNRGVQLSHQPGK
jgi:predicted dehydrogenase